MELISEKRVTAICEHKCSLCGKKIKKGEQYLSEYIKQYGGTHTWETCEKCEEFIKKFQIEEEYFGEGLTQEWFTTCLQDLFRKRFKGLPVKNLQSWQMVYMMLED